MTYEEFQCELGKAGLTAREFADLICMNPNSVTNCSKRGVPAHLAVIASLMGEMREQSVDFYRVLDRIEIQPKKPRGAAKPGKFGGDRQEPLPLPTPSVESQRVRKRASRKAVRGGG